MRLTRVYVPTQVIVVVLYSCGGDVASDPACGAGSNCATSGSGGTAAQVGGFSSLGGLETAAAGGSVPSSTGGVAGCVMRNETYSLGTTFDWVPVGNVTKYPDCIPTCGVDEISTQALPAGVCTSEPTCTMLAFFACSGPDGGMGGTCGGYGFVCQCASGRWLCTIAQ